MHGLLLVCDNIEVDGKVSGLCKLTPNNNTMHNIIKSCNMHRTSEADLSAFSV